MATPTLIQHLSTSNCGAPSGAQYASQLDIRLPNPALGGNCLIMAVFASTGFTINTPTDDAGNTWTAGPLGTDGGNSQQVAVFYALNVTAGTRHITVPSGSGWQTANNSGTFYSACISEFNNIATSSASDGNNTNNNAGSTSWTSGSITTGTAGDLIWSAAYIDNATANTSWSAGTGFTLLHADVMDPTARNASQYQVQGSAGAINAGITLGNASSGIMCTQALKSASAGTAAPTGIYIKMMQYQAIPASAGTALAFQFPTTGNLFLCASSLGTNSVTTSLVSSITDSKSNAWAKADAATSASPNFPYQSAIYYAGNATSATNMTGTLNITNQAVNSTFTLIDVANAATSPLGNHANNTGNQTTTGRFNAVSVTPAQANGLVVAYANWVFGTAFGVNGRANYFDVPTYPQLSNTSAGSAASPLAQDGALAHTYNSGTTQITYGFPLTADLISGGASYWAAAAAEFKASSPANPGYSAPPLPASPVTLAGVNLLYQGGDPLGCSFFPSQAPSNFSSATWELYGSGGAGAQRSSVGGGGGGGGGGYSKANSPSVTAGNTYVFMIAGAGTDGGTVYSGGPCRSCDDAGTILLANSGTSAAANATAAGAGGSTTGAVGDVKNAGGSGGTGGASTGGGGGGGAGNSTGAGGNGGNGTGAAGGAGGTSGGGGGTGGAGHGLTNGAGGTGNNYGGGGGGAYDASSTQTGGNGGPGAVVVTFTASVTASYLSSTRLRPYQRVPLSGPAIPLLYG
jgi:hypothetical protein